ncbi:MAG: UvrB/UvrC motif-containing protein [Pirellulaceae bacterium]|nr:UvrB/UvrC motif-containing protein [Pirellulaceae bacterium]
MRPSHHIDHLLKEWPYDSDDPGVRLIKGADGRDLIQVRLDLGLLQLEVTGRPDGTRPDGFQTLLDSLTHRELESPDFELDEDLCDEIDREFVQFYHRRIAWLRLQRYENAVRDADHTLALMDFCREHSPDEDWTMQHEQHRAFVLFHRTQAAAILAINSDQAEGAIELIDIGLEEIRSSFEEMGWEEFFESDELVERLQELRKTLRSQYSIPKSLQEQLNEAVQAEQYELAARLRDQLARRDV